MSPYAKQEKLNRDLNITISDENDDDGSPPDRFNCCGYYIDKNKNIVDKYGNLVFIKDCLDFAENRYGKLDQAEVPFVFRDRNQPMREKAKEKHMVMLDASQFLKDQLENLQEKLNAGKKEGENYSDADDGLV